MEWYWIQVQKTQSIQHLSISSAVSQHRSIFTIINLAPTCPGYGFYLKTSATQNRTRNNEDQLQNGKLKNYTREERLRIQEAHWLRPWAISLLVSSNRVVRPRGSQPYSRTAPTWAIPLVKAFIPSTGQPNYPRIITCLEEPCTTGRASFLWKWVKRLNHCNTFTFNVNSKVCIPNRSTLCLAFALRTKFSRHILAVLQRNVC